MLFQSPPPVPQPLLIKEGIRGDPPRTEFSPAQLGWRVIPWSTKEHVKRGKRRTIILIDEMMVADIFAELGWHVSETDTGRITKKWSAGEHFRVEYGEKVFNIWITIRSWTMSASWINRVPNRHLDMMNHPAW